MPHVVTPLGKLLLALYLIEADPSFTGDTDTRLCCSQVESLANEALIDDEGSCIWDAHDFLKMNGFYVFPGERDRFGWLTGCIQTTKGIVVFG